MSETIMNVKLKVGYTDDLASRPSNIDQTSSGSNPYVSTLFKQLHKIISDLGNGAWVENTSLIYKGTIGSSTDHGDIQSLPEASASNKGDCYNVITSATYSSQAANKGDWFISNGSTWTKVSFYDVAEIASQMSSAGVTVPEATHALSADTATTATSATTATTAEKLSNTSAIGSTTNPVYFTSGGVPSAISYTIESSVPSNAVFTDTNTFRAIKVDGVQKLATDSTTSLDLTAGSNVTLTESNGVVTIGATDTTYSSEQASSGGSTVSLVTTGEKYTWNNMVSDVAFNSSTGVLSKTKSGSSSTLFTVKDSAIDGDMNPITSNAVYDIVGNINTVLASVL